jgi:hypothetical protein
MDVVEHRIEPQPARPAAVLQELLQLLPGRIFRRAEQSGHRDGAAGIGVGAGPFERLVAQPAAQEAGHEGVAGAEHVVDLDREAWAFDAVLDRGRDLARENNAAHRAALADERRRRDRAGGTQGFERVLRPAEDVQLLLGADDEVAFRRYGLEMRGDGIGADIALLAGAVAGKAPEVRPIVHVEGDAAARGFGGADRLAVHGVARRGREMGAREADGLRGSNVILVDVGLDESHVGAVLAVEDEREALVVLHAERDERGEALGVGLHTARVDALALKLLADETPERLVADRGDEAGLETEPRRADGRVRRAAADGLREGRHVLEPPADLLAVKVDGGAADGDDVEDHRSTFIVGCGALS